MHGNNYFAPIPGPGDQKVQNMVANILPADPPPSSHNPRGMGSKGQNSFFSEHGYVAYQIKCNHEM